MSEIAIIMPSDENCLTDRCDTTLHSHRISYPHSSHSHPQYVLIFLFGASCSWSPVCGVLSGNIPLLFSHPTPSIKHYNQRKREGIKLQAVISLRHAGSRATKKNVPDHVTTIVHNVQ